MNVPLGPDWVFPQAIQQKIDLYLAVKSVMSFFGFPDIRIFTFPQFHTFWCLVPRKWRSSGDQQLEASLPILFCCAQNMRSGSLFILPSPPESRKGRTNMLQELLQTIVMLVPVFLLLAMMFGAGFAIGRISKKAE
jgi:hypothetical protein